MAESTALATLEVALRVREAVFKAALIIGTDINGSA
jgi:hypothetical protein